MSKADDGAARLRELLAPKQRHLNLLREVRATRGAIAAAAAEVANLEAAIERAERLAAAEAQLAAPAPRPTSARVPVLQTPNGAVVGWGDDVLNRLRG